MATTYKKHQDVNLRLVDIENTLMRIISECDFTPDKETVTEWVDYAIRHYDNPDVVYTLDDSVYYII